MKLATRYILREQFSPLITGFVFFTFILVLNKIFIIADLIINKRANLSSVLKLLLFLVPMTIPLTIPMSVLISVILGLNRLSNDNEILALRSSGISLNRIISPVLLSGLLICSCMLIFNETLLVYCNKNYNTIFVQIIKSSPISVLEDNIFSTIGNNTLWIEKVDRKRNMLRNIVLYNRNDSGGWDIIRAQKGTLKDGPNGGKILQMNAGYLFSNEVQRSSFSLVNFKNGLVEISLEDKKLLQPNEFRGINPDELNSFQLFNRIQSIDPRQCSKEDLNFFWVEFYRKHALPFSCFIFSVIGAPLGLLARRGGKGLGFGISILVVFCYYAIFMSGQSFAIKGIFPPVIGVWAANLVLLMIGVFLLLIAQGTFSAMHAQLVQYRNKIFRRNN